MLPHHASEAYLRQLAGFCKLQDQGAVCLIGECLELALWLGGRGQGWVGVVRAECPGPVFLAKDAGCLISTVHLYTTCLFFHLGVLHRAQKQPPVLKLTPRLSPPQVGWLLQSLP